MSLVQRNAIVYPPCECAVVCQKPAQPYGLFLFLGLNRRNFTDSVPVNEYQVLIDDVIRAEV